MGKDYEELIDAEIDIYGDLRCGLAHSYFVGKSCTIAMLNNPESNNNCGITCSNDSYKIIIEKLFKDFEKTFNKLTEPHETKTHPGNHGASTTSAGTGS
ncbi:hypothetical protein GF380_03970 [Candidatus Uhrbacteria bacterium]|nr:hypothetical protein [Candidatus Uhrbacteria bacterium]MBD3284247.1 hypothetical protein [Candidatus Uhrbacteria bacterium]